MSKANDYFAEFLNARTLNGMVDLFEFDLLLKLNGLYRKDYSKHMEFSGWAADDHRQETAFDAVLLTHAHVDHAAYIHYLRPDIPIYCSEATKLIMQAFWTHALGCTSNKWLLSSHEVPQVAIVAVRL